MSEGTFADVLAPFTKQESKRQIVKREISRFKKESSQVFTLSLSDLVMMQMVGDFDSFLSLLSSSKANKKEVNDTIESTKKSSTTHKLFPSIVNKTIEAQFGEKHAALRELGQNAIDSYSSEEYKKLVSINVQEVPGYIVLYARDYGCGMELNELIRDLLIPYNSGKEFDPTKIGEHGIGWYSIVDLADVVKVTTRKKQSGCQALIYQEKEDWKTTILPASNNGFRDDHQYHGTEVCAYIKSSETSKEKLIQYLFTYLGMIDPLNAKVVIDNVWVNSLRTTYIEASSIGVHIENKPGIMKMGVSKRELTGEFSDIRFKHRNQHLGAIIYTQRGLFIKYEDVPFNTETIHYQLISDMISMGMDFWTDIPENVTLTKGRNNIIADHFVYVLDGMYKSFENIFLDILLNDEDVVYHSSNVLMKSIASVFDINYKTNVRTIQTERYSLKRRFMSSIALVGNSLGSLVSNVCVKVSRSIGQLLVEIPDTAKLEFSEAVRAIKEHKSSIAKVIIGVCVAILATYLIMRISAVPFAIGLAIILGLAIIYFLFFKLLPKLIGIASILFDRFTFDFSSMFRDMGTIIKDIVSRDIFSFKFSEKKIAIPDVSLLKVASYLITLPIKILLLIGTLLIELVSYLFSKLIDGLKFIGEILSKGTENLEKIVSRSIYKCLQFFGLFVEVDQKRERKKEKQRKKISKKYLSKFKFDSFFKRIMTKKIIKAISFRSQYLDRERKSVGKVFKEMFSFDNSYKANYDGANYYDSKYEGVKKTDVKISIDIMIDLFLKRQLFYDKNNTKTNFNHGEVWVDYKNPLVRTVVDRLEDIEHEVKRRYDVKVLEDYLENFAEVAAAIVMLGYFLCGIGMVHWGISLFFTDRKKRGNTYFERSNVFRALSELALDLASWCKKRKLISQMLKGLLHFFLSLPYLIVKGIINVAKDLKAKRRSIVMFPILLIKSAASYMYETYAPIAERLHPKKYPEYLKIAYRTYKENMKSWSKRRKQDKENRKVKAENKKETKKIAREEARQIKEARKRKRAELQKQQVFTFFESTYSLFIRWYKQSFVFYLFGYGIIQGKPFNSLSKEKLKEITDVVNVGQAYGDFINCLEKIDSVVSKALDRKPFEIVLSYDNMFIYSRYGRNTSIISLYEKGERHLFFSVDEKSRLFLNIHQEIGINSQIFSRMWSNYSKVKLNKFDHRRDVITFAYRLLEVLIHQSVHVSSSDYLAHVEVEHNITKHPSYFYRRKQHYRRKVVDYMIQNNIDLYSLIIEYLPIIDWKENPYYYISSDDIAKYVSMTKKRLKHEAVNIIIEKEEFVKEQLKKIKKAEETKKKKAEEDKNEEELDKLRIAAQNRIQSQSSFPQARTNV